MSLLLSYTTETQTRCNQYNSYNSPTLWAVYFAMNE